MPKQDTHTPSYDRSHPKQHPALSTRFGLPLNMGRAAIDSCVSPVKVVDAQNKVIREKTVFLSDMQNPLGRDLLLQKTTDLYDNVQLENSKEFRQLELKKL
jgi:hypothetical protein